MTSQNRLNAGAEYVLYRIWATLQSEKGIHVESLLTCVGGLAGYACRQYARQVQTEGVGEETLRSALVDSPLSVWSLVGRAVLKLEQPLPDVQEIVRKATQAAEAHPGASPQLPDWHRPQHPSLVYLKQLWPQTLPIAQRFCLRPMQMPVLYGIALQRAIEHTKDLLSPTLAASIAMECAIAMSRVDLPEPQTAPAIDQRIASAAGPSAGASAANAAPGKPAITALALPSMRATPPSRKTKAADPREPVTERFLSLMKRVPSAAHIATLACLAFLTTATAMYRGDHGDQQEMELSATALVAQAQPSTQEASSSEAPPNATPSTDSSTDSLSSEQPVRTAQVSEGTGDESAQATEASDAPPDANDMPQQSYYAGNDEGVMRDDYGQPIRMAGEEM